MIFCPAQALSGSKDLSTWPPLGGNSVLRNPKASEGRVIGDRDPIPSLSCPTHHRSTTGASATWGQVGEWTWNWRDSLIKKEFILESRGCGLSQVWGSQDQKSHDRKRMCTEIEGTSVSLRATVFPLLWRSERLNTSLFIVWFYFQILKMMHINTSAPSLRTQVTQSKFPKGRFWLLWALLQAVVLMKFKWHVYHLW